MSPLLVFRLPIFLFYVGVAPFANKTEVNPLRSEFTEIVHVTTDSLKPDTLTVTQLKGMTYDQIRSSDIDKPNNLVHIHMKNGKEYVTYLDAVQQGTDRPIKGMPEEFDKTFTKVEIEPEYPGGQAAWQRILQKNQRHVDDAEGNPALRSVSVRFIVDLSGNVSNIEVISGPEKLRPEAIRVIRKSGIWTPAIQNGHQVKSYKTQIVEFQN